MQLKELCKSHIKFLDIAREQCEAVWAQFNPVSIGEGLALLTLASVCLMAYTAADTVRLWTRSLAGSASLLVLVAQAAIFASNSFVVWEASALLYLTSTLGVVHLVVAESPLQRILTVAFLVVTRLASSVVVCREEQGFCSATLEDVNHSLSLVFGHQILVFLGFWSLARSVRSSSLWFSTLFPLGLATTFAHWVIESSPDFDSYPVLAQVLFPRATFVISLGGFLLLVGAYRNPKNRISPHADFLHLFSVVWLCVQLVSGRNRSFPLFCLLLQMALLAGMQGESPPPQNKQKVPDQMRDAAHHVLLASLWGLVSDLGIFTTGHQATFSAIDWNPGFVGLTEMSLILSGAMITVAFFSSTVLFATGVPLLGWLRAGDQLTPVLPLVLSRSVLTLCASAFAAYFQRHLMVWKIFAPRQVVFLFCFSQSVDLFSSSVLLPSRLLILFFLICYRFILSAVSLVIWDGCLLLVIATASVFM